MENFEQILQDIVAMQEQNKALKEELKEKSIIHSALCTEISQLNERNDELDSENETHYRWWKETTKREMILKNQLDLATQLFREAIKITEHARTVIEEDKNNNILSDIDLLETSFKAFIFSQQSLSKDSPNELSEFITFIDQGIKAFESYAKYWEDDPTKKVNTGLVRNDHGEWIEVHTSTGNNIK